MIKVLVDASSDYLWDDANERGIDIVPIALTIDDEQYIEGQNLSRDEFYEILTTTETFPKTSQPSPEEFISRFEKAKENGDELICILLSSALSGTCQTAHLAKNMVDYDKIYIIDSLTATICVKVMADYAVELINKGLSAEEIVETIEAMKSKVKCFAGMNTLEYLAKGGRLNKAVAAVGETVNLKPVITLTEEGGVGVVKKCIGKKQALVQLIKIIQEQNPDEDFPFYIIRTTGSSMTERLQEKLEKAGYNISGQLQVGPTIGSHIGPEAFGVIFVSRK